MKRKDEVFDIFKSFHAMIQTQFSSKIQVLCSDNGGEYVNHQFQTYYFQSHGLLHETTCAQTPQKNGMVEGKNRKILEIARALLINAHAPFSYQSDAISMAVYLLNRLPTKVVDFRTPIQVLSSYVSLPLVLMLPP